MNILKYVFIFLVVPLLFSCEEDTEEDENPDRTTVTVTLQNSVGATGCNAVIEKVTYIVSYRDIQAEATINPGSFGIINVLVEDNESINVLVQSTESDITVANADVNVRTTSRPNDDIAPARKVSYCKPFDLVFSNF